MPERIKPKEIIAIVVGIEKYADKDLDVHGPADDAARFVRWLLDDCEVPAANIRLHLSPLDGFLDGFNAELGVERLAAATDPIKDSLARFPNQRIFQPHCWTGWKMLAPNTI